MCRNLRIPTKWAQLEVIWGQTEEGKINLEVKNTEMKYKSQIGGLAAALETRHSLRTGIRNLLPVISSMRKEGAKSHHFPDVKHGVGKPLRRGMHGAYVGRVRDSFGHTAGLVTLVGGDVQ